MTRIWSKAVVLVGLMMVALGGRSNAQVSSPVGFGFVGGTSSPSGHLSDVAKTGWHAGAFLELKLPVIPFGFRLEGAWHQFGDKPIAGGGGTTGARVVAGTLDATYDLLPLPIIKPYFIGGVGEYSARVTSPVPVVTSPEPLGSPPPTAGATTTTTQTSFGINGGAGVRLQLGGFAAFVEARWHDVFTSGRNVQMVPVSVGVRF